MFSWIKYIIIHIILLMIGDTIWINTFGGPFYAEQLKEIGRFTAEGAFDIRVAPGMMVYLVMAMLLEVFIFRNGSIRTRNGSLGHAALLGFCVYGVFDFTNRGILEYYPMPMVIVDVVWGAALFTFATFVHYMLRKQMNIL